MNKTMITLLLITSLLLVACTQQNSDKTVPTDSIISGNQEESGTQTGEESTNPTDSNAASDNQNIQTDTDSQVPQNSEECFDSDGGLIETKKGYVTDPKGKYEDLCINTKQLKEARCGISGYYAYTVFDCKTTEICQDGACVPSNKSSDCYDSDGGTKEFIAGYVKDQKGIYNDECQSTSYLNEYKCGLVDYAEKKTMFCEAGCKNGACNPVNKTQPTKDISALSTCTDTDGGVEPTIKGNVTDRLNTYKDLCINYRKITEYSCNSLGYKESKDIDCDSTDECIDGACRPIDPANVCSDTDGGADLKVRGTVTDFGEEYTDYCTKSGVIVEYRCSDLTNHLATQSIICPSGFRCVDGACV